MSRRPWTGPHPLGFAHRGARAECRDNTLVSFERALELGARGLESDVWVTADGEAILDHDGVVRHRWRRWSIAGLPRSALPPHIPTLADLYARAGTDFDLSLDVKDPAAVDAVIGVAERFGAARRLWLCSGLVSQLRAWRRRSSDVRLVASLPTAPSSASSLTVLVAIGVDAVNLRSDRCRQDRVDAIHRAGLSALGWNAQRTRTLDRLLGYGIDGVYCDHVVRMQRAIERARTQRPVSEPVQARQRPDPDERPTHEQLAGYRPDDPGVG